MRLAIHIGHDSGCELVAVLIVFGLKACDLPDHQTYGLGIGQRPDFGDQCGRGLEHIPPMDQRNAFGLVWPAGGKVAGPGEGGIFASHNHNVFVSKT